MHNFKALLVDLDFVSTVMNTCCYCWSDSDGDDNADDYVDLDNSTSDVDAGASVDYKAMIYMWGALS